MRAGKTEHESRFGVQPSRLPRPIESSEGGRDDRWIIEFGSSGGPSCFTTLDTKYQSMSRTRAVCLRFELCPSVFDQGPYLRAFKSIGYENGPILSPAIISEGAMGAGSCCVYGVPTYVSDGAPTAGCVLGWQMLVLSF